MNHSFHVEANEIMYLVKSSGFDSSENTWQSSKTLHKCKVSIHAIGEKEVYYFNRTILCSSSNLSNSSNAE